MADISPESRIELVENSFEKIKPQADQFVVTFYQNLFASYPEVEPLFGKTDMDKQAKKLLNSLVLLVENLRQPEVLKPVLQDLGARHKGYGTLPQYYPAVGETLLTTFEQYLGSDWTREVKQAWVETYQVITQLMLAGAKAEEGSSPNQSETPVISATAENNLLDQPLNTQSSDPEINLNSGLYSQKPPPQRQSFSKRFDRADIPKIKTRLLPEFARSIGNSLQKMINLFWELPTGVVAVCSAAVLILFILIVQEHENSFLAKAIDQVETISILLALIIYIKEIPKRQKEFHYQAWSTVDAAKGVKVSYARILALQDLNEDGISLRGLDAAEADLSGINLPKVDLSAANLNKAKLKDANLSHANFDQALLVRADLSGANLSHANFSFAKLSFANLNLANLSHANLICADLRGAYLKNAIMPDGSQHP